MDDLMTTAQAAKYLGISEKHLTKKARYGLVPATRSRSNRWEFSKKRLDNQYDGKTETGYLKEAL